MTLEKNLGYSFSDKNLLNCALTRKAYALEQSQQNQYSLTPSELKIFLNSLPPKEVKSFLTPKELESSKKLENYEDQEIFRTLGDAILKAVLVDLLIKSGCKTRNDITNRKKELEREEKLAEIANNLGIGDFIRMGIGEKKQKANKEPKVLAETLEALIGAIYFDGGYDVSKDVITEWFKRFIQTN